jgi:hypothetical protein
MHGETVKVKDNVYEVTIRVYISACSKHFLTLSENCVCYCLTEHNRYPKLQLNSPLTNIIFLLIADTVLYKLPEQ